MTKCLALTERISAVKCYYQINNVEEVRRCWSLFSTTVVPSGTSLMRLLRKFESTGSAQGIEWVNFVNPSKGALKVLETPFSQACSIDINH